MYSAIFFFQNVTEFCFLLMKELMYTKDVRTYISRGYPTSPRSRMLMDLYFATVHFSLHRNLPFLSSNAISL